MYVTNRRRVVAVAIAVVALLAALGAPGPAPAGAGVAAPGDDLRINEIQVVGSHNSYHLAASAAETALRRQFIGDADNMMQYAHAPLDEQFRDQAVRQIELDVFRDDAGGKYADPLIRQVTEGGAYDPVMNEPGTKVLHTQDVDYRSNCLTLVACLTTVREWSDANPDAVPIAILLELKDDEVPIDGFDFTVPDPWTAAAMDALDEEILSVMPRDKIITPDDIRGDAATLEEAVLDTGWPTLGEARGKVMFLMDNGGGYRTAYRQGRPSLEGRVMFTNASPGQPDAAFVKENDARQTARIQGLVEDGYVVRTRSDADTLEARSGDTSLRDAAFESGAQWVSTDYPVPEYAEPFGTGYVVQVPGGTVARCNPVNGPDGCVSADIEPITEQPPGPEDAYVTRLYEVFLGRAPSDTDRDYWADRLEAGESRERVARALARSREAAGGPVVAAAYTSYLGRSVDPTGRAYWRDRIAAGLPVDKMLVSLLASPEAYAQGGGTPAGWVDLVYRRALGRAADADGARYFTDLLAAGTSRSTVARLVVGSLEARRLRVTQVGTSLLGRALTPAERDAHAATLRTTSDTRDVAIAVVATDEFHG